MTQARRRILREFSIHELSAVDRPAQAHAKMAIMKRHKEPDMDKSDIASFGTLDEAIAAIAKAEKIPRSRAMSAAAREFPHLVEAYRKHDGKPAARPARVAKAVADFETIIRGIQARDGVGRTEALRRARADNPGAFDLYQSAPNSAAPPAVMPAG